MEDFKLRLEVFTNSIYGNAGWAILYVVYRVFNQRKSHLELRDDSATLFVVQQSTRTLATLLEANII